MSYRSSFKFFLAASVAACALSSTQPSHAAPQSFTTPHIDTTAGATQVTLGGQTFVNQGLQGMGRLPSSTLDFNGDSFGAFSSMDILLSTWRKTAAGGYTGTLFSLPDRGPNGIGQVTFSDYAGRTSKFSMAFTPYTGTASLPVSTASQNQLTLTQTGGFFFKDFNGNVTTGLDPGTGAASIVIQNGISLPGPTTGAAAGKISLDAEGLRFFRDGTFYVSDEYGANVYYFDATGKLQGVVKPPSALIPRDAAGNVSYSSLVDEVTGRRVNQGLEGMAITPDGKRLVTLLQSATYQDTNGTSQQTRTNTRLMIYDISQTKTPTAPVADYVLQLPIFNASGSGAPNRTAAQSEILALNGSQFLVLSRDGNGLGLTQTNPVYKTVLLVDTTGATNIAGTAFETTSTPISPGGALSSTITPVQQVELVNILNSTQLGKFGENLNNTAPTRLTLGEKWEGMALAPVLDETKPQDFFLFVGNDNDFLSSTCHVNGQDCSQAVDSDATVLVYRLTLPTYVDPEYLASMTTDGPIALEVIGQAGLSVAQTNAGNVLSQLNAQRRAGAREAGFGGWVAGSYSHDDWTGAKRDGFRGSVGLDYAIDPHMTIGISAGYGQQDGRADAGFGVDADGWGIGPYLSYTADHFYVSGGVSFGSVDLDKITRPAAYGLTASGKTDGAFVSGYVETGYTLDFGTVKGGPLVGYYGDRVDIHAYTETGAAGGNIAVPDHSISSQVLGFGGEVSGTWGGVMPFGRLTYNVQLDDQPRSVDLRLATTQSAMGTQTVSIPTLNEDFVEIGVGVQGTVGRALWHVGYSAQLGVDDRTSHIIRAGVSIGF